MKRPTWQLMTSFVTTFCIINFIVGTIGYALIPGTVSPVPEPMTMLMLGIGTVALACGEALKH